MANLRKFLFESEAVVGIKSPSDFFYMKTVGLPLKLKSSWPSKEMGLYESRPVLILKRCFHFLLCMLCLYGGFSYIFIHFNSLSFFEIGHLYICMLMNMVIFSRITTLTFNPNYRRVAKDFLTKIHLFFHKDRSDFAMKTHREIHRISHIFTMYLTGQMLLGVIMFNVMPMYNNYATGNYAAGGLKNSSLYEHSLYFSYPFETRTNLKGYIIVNIAHWIISYLCASWFCTFDLFLSLMVFHVWGHFKILLYNLDSIPRPSIKRTMLVENITMSYEMFDENESKNITVKIKECIDYHRYIKHFTDEMSNVFGPMLFAYYMFHQASGCLLLLECSQMTAASLMRYVPLTILMFQQLIQLSIIFEIIGSTSEKLKDSVYGLPWECMNTENRKIVAFLLMNVQTPVHVNALGIADVGVTSMATILKTSMSYFTFLRSM